MRKDLEKLYAELDKAREEAFNWRGRHQQLLIQSENRIEELRKQTERYAKQEAEALRNEHAALTKLFKIPRWVRVLFKAV